MRLLYEEEILRTSEESISSEKKRIAVKVWSEPLQAHLWVVAGEEDIEVFRSCGLKEAIYTADEIRNLKGIDNDSLMTIHMLLFD